MHLMLPEPRQHQVRSYAGGENISVEEAALVLNKAGLNVVGPDRVADQNTILWQSLSTLDPGYSFFKKLPESLIEDIQVASLKIREKTYLIGEIHAGLNLETKTVFRLR